MAQKVTPTKGNLLATKKYLDLSTLGYDLLDRKRNILIRELMECLDAARELNAQIDTWFQEAYRALQQANITLGVIEPMAERLPIVGGVELSYRGVMGVELPSVTQHKGEVPPGYSLQSTNSRLDYAYRCFWQARELSGKLAGLENSVYRLTSAIKKTDRRANALQNIIIPRFENDLKFISDSLEEKDREEFSRLKVLKKGREST